MKWWLLVVIVIVAVAPLVANRRAEMAERYRGASEQASPSPADHFSFNVPAEPTSTPAKFAITNRLPSPTASQPPTAISVPQVTVTSLNLEELIHPLINAERVKKGLRPLQIDPRLVLIARNHSLDMGAKNYFAHINLQGEDPTKRGARQGYQCRKDYGSYYTDGLAENLFQNWTYTTETIIGTRRIKDYSTATEIAESTVSGWMASSGHAQNILESDYDKTGIGVAIATNDKIFVTQVFC